MLRSILLTILQSRNCTKVQVRNRRYNTGSLPPQFLPFCPASEVFCCCFLSEPLPDDLLALVSSTTDSSTMFNDLMNSLNQVFLFTFLRSVSFRIFSVSGKEP